MNAAVEVAFLDTLHEALRTDTLVLPTLPELALTIRDIVADEDSSLADVARVINRDPAMSARLIQLANSPLLRSSRTIESVDMAVTRMGGNMVRNIVTAMVMEQLFQATTELTDRKLRDSWQHASEVSAIAVALSYNHPHLQPDQAMLAGLVHDIGMLPILTFAEDHPELLVDEPRLDRLILAAHRELGEAILRHWHFPDSLVRVALEHDNLDHDGGEVPDYVDLVIVANLQSARHRDDLARIPDPGAVPAFRKLGVAGGLEEIDMAAMTLPP